MRVNIIKKTIRQTVSNLRYIQELLEHLSACLPVLRQTGNAQADKSSKTTEIYTHVSKKSIGKIVNHLDNLYAVGGDK